MYQQILDSLSKQITLIKRLSDNAFIPIEIANTDYQTFKKEVATGTPLEDPEGVLMTQAQVDEFLETIP